MEKLELTILMPCLNEEETLEKCIKKAKKFLKRSNINGEILIADNGSTDNSIEIAKRNKARVINVKTKGYGSALIAGTKEAYGKYVIMGDSDDSYDFLNLDPFVKKLRDGYDLVMGNRFLGGIEDGAMPFSHRYIGNPFLSFLGRLFYKSKIGDFHCGLRGYNREKLLNLNLKCQGMEYASEMVVKAELKKFKITEVPTTLKKDGRSRKPHLNTIRDGFRHLKFLIINAPNWLFLLPGIIMTLFGIIGLVLLLNGQFFFTDNHSIGIHSMVYFSSFIIIGLNLCLFFILNKLYSYSIGLIDDLDSITNGVRKIPTYIFVIIGFLLILVGFGLTVSSFITWQNLDFGSLDPTNFMLKVIPANCLLVIGAETIFASVLINIMNIKHG